MGSVKWAESLELTLQEELGTSAAGLGTSAAGLGCWADKKLSWYWSTSGPDGSLSVTQEHAYHKIRRPAVSIVCNFM